jgi:hypothetical protein
MGARKWSTVLSKESNTKGRLWTSISLLKEEEILADAGFNSKEALIDWADSRHYSLKLYFELNNEFWTTNTLADFTRSMFVSRVLFMDLHEILLNIEYGLPDYQTVRTQMQTNLENISKAYYETGLNSQQMTNWFMTIWQRIEFYDTDTIADIQCFELLQNFGQPIMNYRLSVKQKSIMFGDLEIAYSDLRKFLVENKISIDI